MTATDPKQRGKMAREKGKRGELELVHVLNECGYKVRRGKVFYGESDVVGLKGIHIEAKRNEKLNIHAAMEQAKSEAIKRNDGKPAVFFRRNRGEWLVCQRLTDWRDLYGSWLDDEWEDNA